MLGRKTAPVTIQKQPCDVRQWRLKLSFRHILTNVSRKKKKKIETVLKQKLNVWWQFWVNYRFRSCQGPKYTSLSATCWLHKASSATPFWRFATLLRLYHRERETSKSNFPSSAQYGKCIKLICHSNIMYRCPHDKTKLACWRSHMMKASLICPAHLHGRLNSQQRNQQLFLMSRNSQCVLMI